MKLVSTPESSAQPEQEQAATADLASENASATATPRSTWKIIWIILGTGVFLGLAGFGIYYYRANQEFVVTGEIL